MFFASLGSPSARRENPRAPCVTRRLAVASDPAEAGMFAFMCRSGPHLTRRIFPGPDDPLAGEIWNDETISCAALSRDNSRNVVNNRLTRVKFLTFCS
jgi:hypothetical protein